MVNVWTKIEIPNSKVIYVSVKALDKLMQHFAKNNWWFMYIYNKSYDRHEMRIAVGVDLIKDIPSRLGKFITSAE